MPRRDPVAREAGAGDGDLRVALAVELLAVLDARLEEPELLELLREVAGNPGATAELAYTGATTVLDRLLGQLRSLNVPEIRIITRPDVAQRLRKNGHEVIESDGAAGDLREIFRGGASELQLLDERARILREVGQTLVERYNGRFSTVLFCTR